MPLMSGVTQREISAQGPVVGGSYHHHETHNHYASPHQTTNPILVSLYQKYAEDPCLVDQATEIVEELSAYFTSNDVQKTFKDLAEKLTDGSRESYIKEATWQKQLFRRKIERYRHSQTAQLIFAYLLGLAKAYFQSKVHHKLGSVTDEEIDQLLLEDIVERISKQIPGSEPLITHETIFGMLYFLTGNCFLKWVK